MQTKTKYCKWCNAKTDVSRFDFERIGWNGFQFGRGKMVCSCPEHIDLFKMYLEERIQRFGEIR